MRSLPGETIEEDLLSCWRVRKGNLIATGDWWLLNNRGPAWADQTRKQRHLYKPTNAFGLQLCPEGAISTEAHLALDFPRVTCRLCRLGLEFRATPFPCRAVAE